MGWPWWRRGGCVLGSSAELAPWVSLERCSRRMEGVVAWRTRKSLVPTFVDFLGVFTASVHPQGAVHFKAIYQHHVWQGLFLLPHAPNPGCMSGCVAAPARGDTRHGYCGVGTQTQVGCWLPISCKHRAGCSAGAPQRCPCQWETPWTI